LWSQIEISSLYHIYIIRAAKWFSLVLFVVLTMYSWPCQAASLSEKHILILSGNSPDYPAVEAYIKGLKNKFSQYSPYEFTYSYEYFNIERFPNNEEYLAKVAHNIQVKYATQQPDLIITNFIINDDRLFKFIMRYQDDIFSGIPVIALQGRQTPTKAVVPSQITLMPAFNDAMQENIELILQTKPLTKKIYIIAGDSALERSHVNQLAAITQRYTNKAEFVFLNKLTYEEMMEKIGNINDDSVILYLSWMNDVTGKNFIPAKVIQTICHDAKIPVYATEAQFIGAGVVGGYVRQWDIIGEKVADAGLAILHGEQPPDLTNLPNKEYIFDWRQLERWGIKENTLPSDSKIEYKQYSLWEQHKVHIAGSILLILLEAGLILGLIVNRRKWKKAYILIEKISQRLREQDKRKDAFLSSTAHEFKTPLHGIINITQDVLEDAADRITLHQQESLALVISVARRLSMLVHDILDFEKIKHSEINLAIRAVDVSVVADTVLETFRYIVKDGGVTLTNRIPQNLLAMADETRLWQVLYNLIGNAVKFTVCGEVAVIAKVEADKLYISIVDTGIGIPKEKYEDIFVAFEQVSASRSDVYAGTGIGLTISKELVEKMGGNIWVQWSELNKGSSICFTLTLADTVDQNAIGKVLKETVNVIELPKNFHLETNKVGEFTVLVVDDEPTNLRILLNLFAKDNYNALTATSGFEALRLIREHRNIDLVLVDLMMPGMTGYDVCRQIRKEYSLFDLPVLLVTARSEPEDVVIGFAAGVNDFIVKPFDGREVRARVSTLLALKKASADAIRAEVAFLQSQIKPHFFYNVLNTIISFCYTDSIKAGKLLTEFSNYLRRSFDIQDNSLYTSLEEELELVKSYVAIEKARFGERLAVEYDVDVNTMKWKISPLLIQPLVENAVRHGLMQREEGGHIKLVVRKEEDFMIVEVIDDGIGMSYAELSEVLQDTHGRGGVGLKNINRRVFKFYGQALTISSNVYQGITVSFKIPRSAAENVQATLVE